VTQTRRTRDIWIFGYGSLMWDPGFAFVERAPALVHGYHRAFCITSHHYRGTREKPGLVLGLAPGGSCKGIAFRVAADQAEATLAYLHDREMVHYVYVFREVALRLPAGRRVRGQTYVADIRQDRYVSDLALDEAARMIREAAGLSGPNADYLANTIAHLDELGIREGRLHRLLAMVKGG
jgi:cation transport protein ChaC